MKFVGAKKSLLARPQAHPLVIAWANAVVANGGTVSAAQAKIRSKFVAAEISNGLWAITDDYIGYMAENPIQALTSLKRLVLGTVTALPTFTSQGYSFNGSTQYASTGYTPSANAVNLTPNSNHIEVLERSGASSGTTSIGASNGSPRFLLIQPRNGATMTIGASSAGATFSGAGTPPGLVMGGRNGANTSDIYANRNGADLTNTIAAGSVSASLPYVPLWVGALNNAGVISQPRVCSVCYVAFGAALNPAQRILRNANVQTWAASMGALA